MKIFTPAALAASLTLAATSAPAALVGMYSLNPENHFLGYLATHDGCRISTVDSYDYSGEPHHPINPPLFVRRAVVYCGERHHTKRRVLLQYPGKTPFELDQTTGLRS